MSAHMHGTPKGSTLLFATLILATVATWGMGSLGVTGTWGVAILAAISFWKGAVVILDFMALRHAPLLWRAMKATILCRNCWSPVRLLSAKKFNTPPPVPPELPWPW